MSKINQPAQRCDGYKGIWFELGQKSKYGDKYSGGLGTYTANHRPMAVYAPAVHKTFFVYGGTTGATERHLLCMIGCFDHATGLVCRPVVVFDKGSVDDPHDNPAVNLDAQGYLWVLVSGRGRHRPGYKFKSREPYSIDGFELIEEKEMTYPQLWRLPEGDLFLMFTKYTNGRELYFQRQREGVWTPDVKLVGFGGHYQVSDNRKGKIGTFFNFHPGGNVDLRTNLYYMQTTDGGQTWTTAEDKALKMPLENPQNDALVTDYQAEGLLQYTCDLNWDDQDNPLLLFVTSQQALPGPLGHPRRFELAHWNERAWATNDITVTGHNYDMGSLWVRGSQWNVIAPTREGPQRGQGGGEMCLWRSEDGGMTWEERRQITGHSLLNHNYARRPKASQDPFTAFWADGDPWNMSKSHLHFCDASGENVWQLPYEMNSDQESPLKL